jgi:outer membrane lipoprotein-sorting protein
MRKIRYVTLAGSLAILVLVAGCTQVWAGGIAKKIANGLASIKSYQGVTVEKGVGVEVQRSVLYARPWQVRVETLTPGPHAGELFVYDGNTMTLWYPQQLFGVRIHNARPPSAAEALHHIQRLTKVNLDAYTFALQDENAHVAGQRALEWNVRPARRAPYRMQHRVWNHDPSTLPLKMEFKQDGNPWYGFELQELRFDVAIPENAFTFTFPKKAVVFEWDLDAPGISLDEARDSMNFTVKVPSRLPAGHQIQKIVKSPHCLPMILMTMDHDGTMLSLIESRFAGEALHPVGIDITIGNVPATLSFLGAFTVITWVSDGTLLTLTSNLDFPSLIGIAESVQ